MLNQLIKLVLVGVLNRCGVTDLCKHAQLEDHDVARTSRPNDRPVQQASSYG